MILTTLFLLFYPIILLIITLHRNIFGKTYIISVEGNIGSGKSTLVSKLSKCQIKNWYFLQEPVDEWKSIEDSNGDNILSKFYNNQKRYSYLFQNFAFITRVTKLHNLLSKIKSLFSNNYVIIERSIYSDKHVFAKKLRNDKLLSELEYNIYNYWFHSLNYKMLVSGHIYLKVSPSISYERVLKRKRKEEDTIPLEYLSSLNDYHDDWLNNTSVPTLIINCDEDFENNDKKYTEIKNNINSFIRNL